MNFADFICFGLKLLQATSWCWLNSAVLGGSRSYENDYSSEKVLGSRNFVLKHIALSAIELTGSDGGLRGSLRVFKTKAFARFARKSALDDSALCEAIADAERGLIDADLGGGVIKQRLARHGQGKSGGFRVFVLYKRGSRAFFVHGFAKSERANITRDELAALKELASEMLAYSETEIAKAVALGPLIEVSCNE